MRITNESGEIINVDKNQLEEFLSIGYRQLTKEEEKIIELKATRAIVVKQLDDAQAKVSTLLRQQAEAVKEAKGTIIDIKAHIDEIDCALDIIVKQIETEEKAKADAEKAKAAGNATK